MRFLNARFVLAIANLPAAFASTWHVPKSVGPRRVSSGAKKTFKRQTNGIAYNVYEHTATNATLDIVEDSGICETTLGVKTYSGCLSAGTNMKYFQNQAKSISNGSVIGEVIEIVALGINNGWIDPIIQEQAYVDFAYNNT